MSVHTQQDAPAIESVLPSLLSLPDEILDDVLAEALPDDCGTWMFSDTTLWEFQQYATAVLSLSQICRRVHRLSLLKLYRIVPLLGPNNKRRVAFLELMPNYGWMCRKLALRIPGHGASFLKLVELLRHQCKHLTSLQALVLDIRLDDDADELDKKYELSCISQLLSSTRMGGKELQCWKDLCAGLPRLSELQLHGFLLSDAAIGLAEAELSSIRTLVLNVGGPESFDTTARTFNLAFSGLVDITFPRGWCPSPMWIRQAFAGRRLEKIVMGGFLSWNGGHKCSSPVCSWVEAFELLLELCAPSLTSLTITSYLCLGVSAGRAALPYLTSLVLQGMNFRDDEELFSHVMEPFLQSPLRHLGLDYCEGVPELFCDWFDPTSGKWPDLITLSLEQLETTCGPGDEVWDEADPEEREEWDRADDDNSDIYWRSRTRIVLEEMCAKRGIQFNSEWYWFEGYGWSPWTLNRD